MPPGRKQKTSRELAQLILDKFGFDSAYVVVLSDAQLGWRPVVMATASQIATAQERADQIAAELRAYYDLESSEANCKKGPVDLLR